MKRQFELMPNSYENLDYYKDSISYKKKCEYLIMLELFFSKEKLSWTRITISM